MTDALADDTERVLVLARRGRDGELTRVLLGRHGFEVDLCATADDLLRAIAAGASCAILTQEEITEDVHGQLRALFAAQPAWSDFPLVVLATGAHIQERHLALFADLGNVALVDRPVTGQTLLAAVRAAIRGRRRQYEARAAIRQRDQFLAMLGHELRNPLGAIVLATELVDDARVDATMLGKRIETIARQAHHLARLVDDLLDVARVTSGKVRLRRELVDLHDVIAGCIDALDAFARDRAIRVTLLPGPAVRVDGDGVRLEQVFNNLLTNAIKYSPAGGAVTISTAVADGLVEVCVRDDGIGIEPAMAGRIFDLFAQVDGTIDRSHGGMGIGLTLVKRLVELHDGSVAVRSDGLGTGSEFIVRLPCSATRPRLATPPGIAPVIAPTPAAVRVVLVDDNDDIRELSRAVLEKLGCIVEDAADGPSGLACILRAQPDLALVDLGLPGLDGFGVANAVRAQLGPAPLLVAVTGYGQPQDQEHALAAGFDVHLTKPVHTVALRAMVERARQQRGAPAA